MLKLSFISLLAAVSVAALEEVALSAPGIKATFIPYGARLKSLRVPDRDGNWKEVNLGYETAQEYRDERSPSYFGAVIG